MKYSWKGSLSWSFFIFVLTFILACILSLGSNILLGEISWGLGFLLVFFLVGVGIFFDMMGLAAAVATEKPFHAMAAEKIKGAKQAVYIIRNADRVSSFCNDVVGDVCGIISGVATALVSANLIVQLGFKDGAILSTIFSAIVSSLTVGGKALGKSYAITKANMLVLWMGQSICFFESKIGFSLFARKRLGKRGKTHATKADSTPSRF